MAERAQIHTLEAFVAALLIVGALLFASQATAVTPLSASTSNQHIENQQQQMAADVLAITADEGTLREALLYWNTSEGEIPSHFAEIDDPDNQSTYSTLVGTDHPLNATLHDAFGSGVYAYNIELRYLSEDRSFEDISMVKMGTPSDNAVTATRTVVLFDHDRLWHPDPAQEGDPLRGLDEDDFWMTDVDPDSSLYNVVEVRLTIWRM